MTEIVFHAHSGLRYLVLAAGLLLILYSVWGMAAKRPVAKPGRTLASAFTGLLDLQVAVGLALIFMIPYYPALMGHVAMMVLAAGVAHGAGAVNRRRDEEERSHALHLAGAGVALLLIVGGILAIQRSIV